MDGKSKSEDYILVSIESSTTSESRLIDANAPEKPMVFFLHVKKDVNMISTILMANSIFVRILSGIVLVFIKRPH